MYRAVAAAIIALAAQATHSLDSCGVQDQSALEKAMCGNHEILRLESILNRLYQNASIVKPGVPTPSDQAKKLISSVRGSCDSVECALSSYDMRISEFLRQAALSKKIDPKPMGTEEAVAICDQVADAVSNKNGLDLARYPAVEGGVLGRHAKLPPEIAAADERSKFGDNNLVDSSNEDFGSKIYYVKLGETQKLTKLTAGSRGGSCTSEYLSVSDQETPFQDEYYGSPSVYDANDELRVLAYSGYEYPIAFRGRNLVVSSSRGVVHLISWIRPDGQIRPICTLNVKQTNLTAAEGSVVGVCGQISQGKAVEVQWDDGVRRADKNGSGSRETVNTPVVNGERYDDLKTLSLRVRGSEDAVLLGRLSYYSHAGCGSYREWLHVIPEPGGKTEYADLDDALSKIGQVDKIRVYAHSGGTYISFENDRTDSVSVYELSGDAANEECRLGIEKQYTVRTVFRFPK